MKGLCFFWCIGAVTSLANSVSTKDVVISTIFIINSAFLLYMAITYGSRTPART